MSFPAFRRPGRLVLLGLTVFFISISNSAQAQTALDPGTGSQPAKAQPGQIAPADASSRPTLEDKRVLGVLPNYRTANSQAPFQRLSVKDKFVIATKDSTDYPVFFTTAFFAGMSQITGADGDIYGGGVKGFAHRYGISYADQVVGNFFPEAIVPAILHIDPRYFRKSTGTAKSRFAYAVSRLFVCKDDNGNLTFNYPELVGNSLASMTAMSYHVHERTAGDAAYQTGTYLLTDLTGQILKEFWPDIKRHLHGRRSTD